MIIESLRSLATPIENLKALPGNPRKGDVDAVAKSLERFGQRKPIVARKDDGTIIAGNHTWQAAKKLGWSEIAVAFVGDDDVTAKAYALADNRTAELGSYDEQALIDLIEEVHAVVPEFVRDAGWSDDAVAELVAKIESEQPPKEINEDEIPELPVEPVTKLGDIWQIKNIEIHCQDSFSYLLPACDVLISDPPYGMNVDFSWYGGKIGNSLGGNRIIQSKHQKLEKPEWDRNKFNPSKFIQHSKTSALFGANYYYEFLPPDGTWWVWDKRTTASGEIQDAYGMPYEMIWISGKRKSNIIRNLWAGFTRKAEDVDKERLHPTQKPVAVMREIIEYLTDENDIILDPFAGSGSTLVACSQLNKKAIGIEFNPKYVDIIINRLEKVTGEKAVLVENAESAKA